MCAKESSYKNAATATETRAVDIAEWEERGV